MGSILGGLIQAGATMDAAQTEADAAKAAAAMQQQTAEAAVQAGQTGYKYLTSGAGAGPMSNYVNSGQIALGNEGTTSNMIAQLLGEAPTSATADWRTSNPGQAPLNLPGNPGMPGYNTNTINPSYTGPISPATTNVNGFNLASTGTPGTYNAPSTPVGQAGGNVNPVPVNPASYGGGAMPPVSAQPAGGAGASPNVTSGAGTPSAWPAPGSITSGGNTAGVSTGAGMAGGGDVASANVPANARTVIGNPQRPSNGYLTSPSGVAVATTNGVPSYELPNMTGGQQGTLGRGNTPAYAGQTSYNNGGGNPNVLAWPGPAGIGGAKPSTGPTAPTLAPTGPPSTTPTPAPTLGPTPNANNAFQNYLNSTAYQFQLGQGTGAIQANAGTSGLLDSGATAKALTQFGQNLAGTTFNNYLGQLGGLQAQQAQQAGAGQNALGQIATVGTTGGSASANALTNAGSGIANTMMAGANATGNAIAGLGGSLGNMFSQFGGPGGNTSFMGGFGGFGQSGGGAQGGGLGDFTGGGLF